MKYQFIPIKSAKTTKCDNAKSWRRCESTEFLIQTLGSENGHDHFGKFVFISMLNISVSYNSAILLLGIHPRKSIYIRRHKQECFLQHLLFSYCQQEKYRKQSKYLFIGNGKVNCGTFIQWHIIQQNKQLQAKI